MESYHKVRSIHWHPAPQSAGMWRESEESFRVSKSPKNTKVSHALIVVLDSKNPNSTVKHQMSWRTWSTPEFTTVKYTHTLIVNAPCRRSLGKLRENRCEAQSDLECLDSELINNVLLAHKQIVCRVKVIGAAAVQR